MSNTMNTPPTIRWQLLSTASAFALLASAYTAQAEGTDADRPLIWVELGGQMVSVTGQGEAFTPAFIAANSTSSVLQSPTPLQAQKPPRFGFGEDGKISFQPDSSNWVFSAAIRFGRSNGFRHLDHQTNRTYQPYTKYGKKGHITTAENFADTQAHRSESHAILDFTVGKDVGLGLFGREGSSVLSAGVRFAQFASKEAFDIRARPDLYVKYLRYNALKVPFAYHHDYHASGHASRSFHGVGPSLSWNGSTPFAGNRHDGELMLDWGMNAGVLFGKQKARARHQESAHYYHGICGYIGCSRYTLVYQNPPTGHDTDRSVTVPNVGGSVGLSWRVQDFKVSLGYRADFFFGAMDTGIDAVKKSNATFNGPYASISIGLGG